MTIIESFEKNTQTKECEVKFNQCEYNEELDDFHKQRTNILIETLNKEEAYDSKNRNEQRKPSNFSFGNNINFNFKEEETNNKQSIDPHKKEEMSMYYSNGRNNIDYSFGYQSKNTII